MSTLPGSWFRYVLISLIILIAGMLILTLWGVFFPMAGAPMRPTQEPGISFPEGSQMALAVVDSILRRATQASMTYNVPAGMRLDETQIVQLVLNPVFSEQDLEQQVQQSDVVATGTIEVTPLMKADLKPYDPQAFVITPLHDSPEQPLSEQEPTRWQWQITAIKGGRQGMTLVLYRMIRYENREYWREVGTYSSQIVVHMTFWQRMRNVDWKWLIGLLLTSIFVPMLLRWWEAHLARSQEKRESPGPPDQTQP